MAVRTQRFWPLSMTSFMLAMLPACALFAATVDRQSRGNSHSRRRPLLHSLHDEQRRGGGRVCPNRATSDGEGVGSLQMKRSEEEGSWPNRGYGGGRTCGDDDEAEKRKTDCDNLLGDAVDFTGLGHKG